LSNNHSILEVKDRGAHRRNRTPFQGKNERRWQATAVSESGEDEKEEEDVWHVARVLRKITDTNVAMRAGFSSRKVPGVSQFSQGVGESVKPHGVQGQLHARAMGVQG
jgi:hypothetical protein